MAKAEEDRQEGFQKKSPQTGRERKDRWKISVYSWKLESTDKLPKGKNPCLSLRKLEKQVNTDLDLLVNIVDVSVFEGLV